MNRLVIYLGGLLSVILIGLGVYGVISAPTTEKNPDESKESEVVEGEKKSSNVLTCTKNVSEEGYTLDENLVISFKNDQLVSYQNTYKMSATDESMQSMIEYMNETINMLIEAQENVDGFNIQSNYENNISSYTIEHDLEKVSYDQINGELKEGLSISEVFSKGDSFLSTAQYLVDEDYTCDVNVQKQTDFSANVGKIYAIDETVSVTNNKLEYKHIKFDYESGFISLPSYSITNKTNQDINPEINIKFYDENKNEIAQYSYDLKETLKPNEETKNSFMTSNSTFGNGLTFSDFKYFSIENID